MALNWAMISEDGARPVPLPGEKIFHSAEKCEMSLDFPNQGKRWKAKGTAFVTSQRILFLRQPPLPAPADPSVSSDHLRSLSVPLSQFIETRYLIPVFSAPYYEATVVPSPEGGLPQRTAGQSANAGLLKIWFNEGGGMALRDAVEEVKSRREEGASNIEALPLYEAGPDAPTGGTSALPAGSLDAAPPLARPRRSDTLPHDDDMIAAQVAREQEERERDAQREQAHRAVGDDANELPPAYHV